MQRKEPNARGSVLAAPQDVVGSGTQTRCSGVQVFHKYRKRGHNAFALKPR